MFFFFFWKGFENALFTSLVGKYPSTLLEAGIVRHLDKVRDLVLGHVVVVDPAVSLAQRTVDAVLPDALREVH